MWSEEKSKIARRCSKKHILKWNWTKNVCPKRFLYLRCRKIARRCGAKQIFNWKCTKNVRYEALFVLAMSKNCTPLWREARSQIKIPMSRRRGGKSIFQVKMLKNWGSGRTFWSSDVEKLQAALARSAFSTKNVQTTCVLARFLKFICRKISQSASSSVNQSAN